MAVSFSRHRDWPEERCRP
ncbi:hypothetical protein FWK35_00038085 [Aphis craccivora]|uniref:Uncharacterized protein n=1 Tax=Aphis craccivora TaxID=307492 RepID=A0A6G0VJA9_APHCR|nr:hypothetical protein FWK35_00038085 [Aphis craccivora]